MCGGGYDYRPWLEIKLGKREIKCMVRIGIMDKETEYVTKLCVYLNGYGKGIWNMSAFTEKEALIKQMCDKRIDVLVATNEDALMKMKERFPDRCYVWLIDEKEKKVIFLGDGVPVFSDYIKANCKMPFSFA